MPEQLSFDWGQAQRYLRTMLRLEVQRDAVNAAIADARAQARDLGVPTKAVEAALRAAKGRRKARLTPLEFGQLMDEAERLVAQLDEEPDAVLGEIAHAG